MTTVLVFAGLIVLLLSGMPVFAALGLTATVILLVFEGSISSVGDTVFSHLNKDILTTIPLFVLMAQVMIRAKVIDDLYDFANSIVGHVKGGLGVATVLSCTIFAAISGSSVATALSIGASALPQMKRFGYPERDGLGVIAAGGTLGILIPPSGPMILYAIVSEVSIGALFLAGLLPGLILAGVFAVFCIIQGSRRQGQKAPERQTLRQMIGATKASIWALLAPPMVMGGIYFGIFTASEAAAVGALYALLVAVGVYRNFGWSDLFTCLHKTMRTSVCLLYTSPSPRDRSISRMPSSA